MAPLVGACVGQVKQVLLQRGSLPACFDIRADTVVELLKLPADGDMVSAAKESMFGACFPSVRMSGPFLLVFQMFPIFRALLPFLLFPAYRCCAFWPDHQPIWILQGARP